MSAELLKKPSPPVVAEHHEQRQLAVSYRANCILLSDLGVKTVIDADMEVEGNIRSTTSVAIKGRIKGEVRVTGDSALIFLFPGSRVDGLVRARYVWIAGEVQGRVECKRLLILSDGKFCGESVCESLEVKHGGEYFPTHTARETFDHTV